jgi:hypothetical protein
MTENDLIFVQQCIGDGLIAGPVLELGGGYGGTTCRELIVGGGFEYFSTDMPGVRAKTDFEANFESGEGVDAIGKLGHYKTILVLNVLEHTFRPINVLDNVLRLLERGGSIVTATPCVWPIHNFPIDCSRLLPDWYRQYADHSKAQLLDSHFVFIGYGKIENHRIDDTDRFPLHPGLIGFSGWRSRAIHKFFNTAGRGVEYRPHISIGAVFRKL